MCFPTCTISIYSKLCVFTWFLLVLCYPFYFLIQDYDPVLIFKSNGWYMICQSDFHMLRYLLHDLLWCFLIYLIHLFPHIIYFFLGHWNVHLFCCREHHVQWNRHHYLWSGLIKGWWMGRLLKPLYTDTWMLWQMWISVTTFRCWIMPSTIYLVTWFGLVDTPPSDVDRVEHHISTTQ